MIPKKQNFGRKQKEMKKMQSSYNAPAPGRYTPPAVTPNAPYGAPAGIPPVPKKKKADGKLILILALVFAVLIAAVILIFCLTRTQKTGSADDILQSFMQESYNHYLQNDAPGDTADSASEYNEPVYEEDEPAVYDSWEDAPGDRLYRPSSGYFVDQYSMYAFCIDTAVQDYVKLRMGPSKEHFNVVGQISNNTVVTVQTEDVDGWTLCYANGMEGWIRSDFLFDEYHVE